MPTTARSRTRTRPEAGAPPVPGGPPEPGSDPNAQGGEGADKTPAPPTQGGSDAAFGSNQVESPV